VHSQRKKCTPTRENPGYKYMRKEPPPYVGMVNLALGTSDYETYDIFFDYLKRKLSQCSSPPVVGSDDEKAMRKAMKGAFLDSCSLVCQRHLKQNAANHLTDKVGVSRLCIQLVISSLSTKKRSALRNLLRSSFESDQVRFCQIR